MFLTLFNPKYAQNNWGHSAQGVASYGKHLVSKKGRKRKTPQNWASEHEDFEAKKKCTSDGKEAKC